MTKTTAEKREELIRKNNDGNTSNQKNFTEIDGTDFVLKNDSQAQWIQKVKINFPLFLCFSVPFSFFHQFFHQFFIIAFLTSFFIFYFCVNFFILILILILIFFSCLLYLSISNFNNHFFQNIQSIFFFLFLIFLFFIFYSVFIYFYFSV